MVQRGYYGQGYWGVGYYALRPSQEAKRLLIEFKNNLVTSIIQEKTH